MTRPSTRRRFLGTTAASAAAVTIVPRHVLGGPGRAEPAPSDRITFGYVGCGTQGLTEMARMLRVPEVQIVAVCDPNEESTDYVEWGKDSVRRDIAEKIGRPDWRAGSNGAPGGRVVGREIAEIAYADQRGQGSFSGVKAYSDFRELLEKEDVDAVKVMTPDHLHATVALAAMRKRRGVLMHKPLANRLAEARLVVDAAKKTGVPTHFLPASAGDSLRVVREWIGKGAIGTLREIHNWSNRPVWPQYDQLPTDTPPVPKGFDWDLWLGPSLPRPYHPHFTHAVFRGWYEFGGGAVADMGHYSLWPVFQQFELDAPVSVETTPSHVSTLVDGVATEIRNEWSFPHATTIRFRFAAKAARPAIDIFWYDGGIRPPVPPEMEEDGRELGREGMMFVGDAGKIVAGFECDDPAIVPHRKAREFRAKNGPSVVTPTHEWEKPVWIEHFRGGAPTFGSFTAAGPISDAVNLAAISMRLGGRKLLWDEKTARITNVPEANALLAREYRKGWELTPV